MAGTVNGLHDSLRLPDVPFEERKCQVRKAHLPEIIVLYPFGYLIDFFNGKPGPAISPCYVFLQDFRSPCKIIQNKFEKFAKTSC